MRIRYLCGGAAAVAAVACVVLFWRHGAQGGAGLQHWLAIHTGTLNESEGYYGFWSGFGSDLGEVALLGAIGGLWHKHNCHTKGCWRIGRHVVTGTPWCNRHHDGARQTAADDADTQPPFASIEGKLDKLSEDIGGLAEAIRAAMLMPPPRKGTRL
jgi:hypothetical protein